MLFQLQSLADRDCRWNVVVWMLDAVAYVSIWQTEIIGGMWWSGCRML
jgi:hypothetical protein